MVAIIIVSVILLLLVPGVVIMLVKTVPIAKAVYFDQLVKDSPEKWPPQCSCPENEEQMIMWNEGLKWSENNKEHVRKVSIEHDGLKLYGEFYDFGSDKCVIILPGRTECLKYSYYFAEPYKKAGLNVLVIDQRAHGSSDGIYNTIGTKEWADDKEWGNFAVKELGMKEIWFHGICIGSASATLIMSDPDINPHFKGMVVEGMFTSFYETFKRHIKFINKPAFPVCGLVMLLLKKYAGAHTRKNAPIRHVGKIKGHVLFLYGKLDTFSVPSKSRKIFAKCSSKTKELVWFDKGAHSHLRINNVERYDNAIIEYIRKQG